MNGFYQKEIQQEEPAKKREHRKLFIFPGLRPEINQIGFILNF